MTDVKREPQDEIRDEYQKLTGKRHWTNPGKHGEPTFNAWDYQLWLENEILRLRNTSPDSSEDYALRKIVMDAVWYFKDADLRRVDMDAIKKFLIEKHGKTVSSGDSSEGEKKYAEFVGRSYWWCPECREEVGGENVTYEEFHDKCGHPVIGKTILPDSSPHSNEEEPTREAIEQAHMAGQAFTGIDPSYSEARLYFDSLTNPQQHNEVENCKHDFQNGEHTRDTCKNCGKSIYE